MQTTVRKVKVKDLTARFEDRGEEGVVGYNRELDIRPAYQREFVYTEKQQQAVIQSILEGFPLNTFYWGKTSGGFELLDGQQRTMSICNYVEGKFSIPLNNHVSAQFNALSSDQREAILNYVIEVYICEGTESEMLKWFNVINTGGTVLTLQELRNACYTGSWLSDAKKHFSKSNCIALKTASYDSTGKDCILKGQPDRQEILETVLHWYADFKGKQGDKVSMIEQIMSECKFTEDASDMFDYFKDAFNWFRNTFVTHRKEMKGIQFGLLYNQYRAVKLNPLQVDTQINTLLQDEDVTKKSGVFEYILSGDEKLLSIRSFSDKVKTETFEKQKGVCPICQETFKKDEMQY